jgi:hypothetical protein
MVAYIDVFTFMMAIVIITIPLLLVVRPRRERAAPVAVGGLRAG